MKNNHGGTAIITFRLNHWGIIKKLLCRHSLFSV